MTEHIVALFETESVAAAAERDLESAGIPTAAMRRYTPTDMEKFESEPSVAGTTETTHSGGGGFWAWLWGEDSETTTASSAYSHDGDVYDRRARDGNYVLSVMLDDPSLIHQTITILDKHHPIEVEEHTHETGHSSGSALPSGTMAGTSLSPSAGDYSTTSVATPAAGMAAPYPAAPGAVPVGMAVPGRVAPVAASTSADEVISLAEEQLEVGKRTVERGTTRVRRYVVEKPVEQSVTLHGERVTIERRVPTEGTTTAGTAFEERTVEVRETEEVPVVGKTARVVEEVLIRKEATERTETVRDTVRREEVEVTGNDTSSKLPRP